MASIELSLSFNMEGQTTFTFGNGLNSASVVFWKTSDNFTIVALSAEDDITLGAGFFDAPTGGTISGIFVTNPQFALTYSVTGFTAPVTALLTHETYWETLLAGVTTFKAVGDQAYGLTGDFINVTAGQTLVGAADSFDLPVSSPLKVVGDAFNVSVGGTLTGGADRFIIGNGAIVSAEVSGDVDTHAGTVTGGADVINIRSGLSADSVISGDALVSDGVLTGGADRITLSLVASIATPDFIVTGDAQRALRQVTGGNDIIVVKPLTTDIPDVGISLSGDVHLADNANSFVIGGDDTITYSVTSGAIAGDVMTQSAGAVIGGDDTITVNSTIGILIAGDVLSFTGGILTPGNDTIKGGSGADQIFGESGTSNFPATPGTTVNAGGNDIIDGRDGNDSIKGQVGNDIITGGLGNDSIDGGSGNDTAAFDIDAAPIFVDLLGLADLLLGGNPVCAIGQGFDVLLSVENVIGSIGNDTIKGDSLGNVFSGNSGNDILLGRAGADTLTGGRGQDRLNGGTGNDIFDFNATTELSANSTKTDVIIGFATGDKIDISGIVTGKANINAPFTFQTTPLTGVGQVTFATSGSDVIVSGSTDADATAEFTILLKGIGTLTSADFIL